MEEGERKWRGSGYKRKFLKIGDKRTCATSDENGFIERQLLASSSSAIESTQSSRARIEKAFRFLGITEDEYENEKSPRRRLKALKVLGVTKDDIDVSLRFFYPRRTLYGSYFPGTRATVIRNVLKKKIPNDVSGVITLILSYEDSRVDKFEKIPNKALRILGTKRSALGRYKALKILGESNHEVEETNARDLARLGSSHPSIPMTQRGTQRGTQRETSRSNPLISSLGCVACLVTV